MPQDTEEILIKDGMRVKDTDGRRDLKKQEYSRKIKHLACEMRTPPGLTNAFCMARQSNEATSIFVDAYLRSQSGFKQRARTSLVRFVDLVIS